MKVVHGRPTVARWGLAFAAAAVLAGCSGGSSDTQGSGTTAVVTATTARSGSATAPAPDSSTEVQPTSDLPAMACDLLSAEELSEAANTQIRPPQKSRQPEVLCFWDAVETTDDLRGISMTMTPWAATETAVEAGTISLKPVAGSENRFTSSSPSNPDAAFPVLHIGDQAVTVGAGVYDSGPFTNRNEAVQDSIIEALSAKYVS